MFYFKSGFPEENEIVVCTVTSVQYNSVFCTLDEYDKQGMIHISEVSAGRIRNLREFVEEGKKVVCKVLRINEERGHIDLSLRRVTEGQKREKSGFIKQEQKAEKIIENLAAELKVEPAKLYEAIATPILKRYEYLHMAFQEHVDGEADLATMDIPKEYIEPLVQRVIDKIKPQSVKISGTLTLATYAERGIEVIRAALEAAAKIPNVEVTYLGSGAYKIDVTAEEYKNAEETIKKAVDAATALLKKSEGGTAEFVRA